jgi:hypothetical protein
MEAPISWSYLTTASEGKEYYSVDNYTVYNISATNNGSDIESMTDAYNNYKKTIGTFDTLVTCRDYMNRIYQMTAADSSATNLVSNIIVSDIRDDINKAMTVCTFTERGIEYKTMAKPINVADAISITKTAIENILKNDLNGSTAGSNHGTKLLGKVFKVTEDSNTNNILYYARCIFNGKDFDLIVVDQKELTHFDLVLYPFTNTYGLNSKQEYINSFKYNNTNLLEITQNLEENKTLSHNFVTPEQSDIACIKNYYRLSAKVTTTKRVNPIEQLDILGKVYSKLYEKFNMHEMDFGEEIPYETILEIMESADSRIKYIRLEDPEIITKFCTVSGAEFPLEAPEETTIGTDKSNDQLLADMGKAYYNKLMLNNVIAGRIPLFNYDNNFKSEYSESKYPS